jgi:hypothetical protein
MLTVERARKLSIEISVLLSGVQKFLDGSIKHKGQRYSVGPVARCCLRYMATRQLGGVPKALGPCVFQNRMDKRVE